MERQCTSRQSTAPAVTRQRSTLCACLVVLVCLLMGCSDGDRMRQQLHDLQALNQADSLMTNDSLATALCHYFDRHGTANERMLAHYLMGRTWADKGEAPQALEEYHTAADCADTTATGCDYRLLTRIYAQSANLFYAQLMPNEMLEELNKMEMSAIKAEDTISRIISTEWRGAAYSLLNKKDSTKLSLIKAYNDYRQNNLNHFALNCLPGLIDILITEEDFTKANYYIHQYEKSPLHYQEGNVIDGREIYYYYKGNYYVGINKTDSAEYFYRRLVRSCQNKNDLEAAYKGLYELFKLTDNTDSVAKYANLCYQTSEERFHESSSEQLRHMQSLYNYGRHRIAAEKKAVEAEQSRRRTTLLFFVLVVIVIVSGGLIGIIRRRKQEEMSRLIVNYQHAIDVQEQAKYDLMQMQRQQTARLLEEKQQEIDERQQEIERMRQMMGSNSSADCVEKELTETEIFRRFHELSKNVRERVYKKDWVMLCKTIEEILPDFHAALLSHTHVKEKDYYLCILIRLHFSLSEIGILLGETPQYLSKKRRQLLYVLFKQDGKPELFDKLIQSKKIG